MSLFLLLLLAVSIGRLCECSTCASCTGTNNNNNIPTRFINAEQPFGRSRRDVTSALMKDESTTKVKRAVAETKIQLLDSSQASNPIPIEFYREFSNITDVADYEELFERYATEPATADPQQQDEGSSKNHKRSVTPTPKVQPKPAACITDNEIVPLFPEGAVKDSSIFYVPSCTRVQRCSGCCVSLLSCQPTEIEIVELQILEYKFGERTSRDKHTVRVEQHLRCVCDCRVKAEDCNAYQIYDAKNCRCDCTNYDEKNKCNELEHKIWDEEECRCVCRDNHSCTTGTFFDEGLCKCVILEVAATSNYFRAVSEKESSLLDRKRLIVEATPIDTDNSTIYAV